MKVDKALELAVPEDFESVENLQLLVKSAESAIVNWTNSIHRHFANSMNRFLNPRKTGRLVTIANLNHRHLVEPH